MEKCHKSLKRRASIGKSPTKALITQANHTVATVLTYTKIKALKFQCGIDYFRLKV